jgi:hypothetical protein
VPFITTQPQQRIATVAGFLGEYAVRRADRMVLFTFEDRRGMMIPPLNRVATRREMSG